MAVTVQRNENSYRPVVLGVVGIALGVATIGFGVLLLFSLAVVDPTPLAEGLLLAALSVASGVLSYKSFESSYRTNRWKRIEIQ